MTNIAPPKLFSRLWTSVLVSGVFAVILGVLVLVWPGISILVAAVLFGVYLVVSGVAMVIFALSLPVSAGTRILMFLSGAASLVLAVLAFRHFGQGYAVLLLAIWIAVGFIFQGVATTGTAISEPGIPGRGWAIFVGVMSIIAGVVVLAWPFDSIVVLALVVGIWLIVIGVLEIVSAFRIRSAAKNIEGAWHGSDGGQAVHAA
ncbi:HdeD family acid-resistance protein [Mycobacterium sp.]|uniref:HdeD family acid-resistance protein n=1 Tax=Mycobacterium sp. TaxID=1785 RepID=UPI002C27EDA6|nr:HdeD family acid-resistance protein [Mycobacterium sp.]HME46806.1 HdeD family acid-resistance protein [Mycobacterium sp.]